MVRLRVKEPDSVKLGTKDPDRVTLRTSEHITISGNYEDLLNKPSINGVELDGDNTSEDLKIIYRGTTAYWNAQPSLISEAGALYIYTDYQTVDNGDGTYTIYPAIKVGDGTSYVTDMPFASSDNPLVAAHIEDSTIHVTAEEKAFWNAKWAGYIDGGSPENLIFTVLNIPQIY